MSTPSTDSILLGLEALLAIAETAFQVLSPEAAALIAGIKTIRDHAASKTDSATMMADITSLDAAAKADNVAADSALDAKFKGG